MPDWLRNLPDAGPNCDRALASHDPYLLARCRWAASGLRQPANVSAGPALARPGAVLRVFPWRQRRGHRCEPPDWLDRIGRQADPAQRLARRQPDGPRRYDCRTGAPPMIAINDPATILDE